MKIGIVNSYLSFKANDNENRSKKSFMGRVSDGISGAIDGVTTAIDSTSKAAEGLSDIAKSARNALSSPEEATIGVLTDQIDDKVVNNEKVPNWIRKTASYGSAVLAAGGTFIAIRKTPGVINNFVVKNLGKFRIGSKILDGFTSVKQSLGRFADAIGRERVNSLLTRAGSFISEKTPKFIKTACEKVKLNKLKDWTKGDYIKNGVAALLGFQTGGSVLSKHQNKIDAQNNGTQTPAISNNDKVTEPEVIEPEIVDTDDDTDYSEAA